MAVINGNNGFNVLRGTIGNDVINGLGAQDRLLGFAGNDVLHGGPGHDWLDGGKGADKLFGGPGYDIFNFKSVETNFHEGKGGDKVMDFEDGVDQF